MLKLLSTTRFKKSLKQAAKRGKNIDKLENVINLLQAQKNLPIKYRDHSLTGQWSGHRECHIEPDWLLVYRIEGENLILIITGSHADLF